MIAASTTTDQPVFLPYSNAEIKLIVVTIKIRLGTTYFNVHVVVQQQVFSLQISMHHAVRMTVTDRGNDLSEYPFRFRFRHPAFGYQMIYI